MNSRINYHGFPTKFPFLFRYLFTIFRKKCVDRFVSHLYRKFIQDLILWKIEKVVRSDVRQKIMTAPQFPIGGLRVIDEALKFSCMTEVSNLFCIRKVVYIPPSPHIVEYKNL